MLITSLTWIRKNLAFGGSREDIQYTRLQKEDFTELDCIQLHLLIVYLALCVVFSNYWQLNKSVSLLVSQSEFIMSSSYNDPFPQLA